MGEMADERGQRTVCRRPDRGDAAVGFVYDGCFLGGSSQNTWAMLPCMFRGVRNRQDRGGWEGLNASFRPICVPTRIEIVPPLPLSTDILQEWYSSDEYKKLNLLRDDGADVLFIMAR